MLRGHFSSERSFVEACSKRFHAESTWNDATEFSLRATYPSLYLQKEDESEYCAVCCLDSRGTPRLILNICQYLRSPSSLRQQKPLNHPPPLSFQIALGLRVFSAFLKSFSRCSH